MQMATSSNWRTPASEASCGEPGPNEEASFQEVATQNTAYRATGVVALAWALLQSIASALAAEHGWMKSHRAAAAAVGGR
jgi:hypothetical protein